MKRYIDSGKTGIIWGLLSSLFFSLVGGTGKYYVYNPYTFIDDFMQVILMSYQLCF